MMEDNYKEKLVKFAEHYGMSAQRQDELLNSYIETDLKVSEELAKLPTAHNPIPTIKPGAEGYQPIEPNPLERCHASHRGYTCTLNKHHITNHAAHTPSIKHGYVIAHAWPQALMSSRKRERENEQ